MPNPQFGPPAPSSLQKTLTGQSLTPSSEEIPNDMSSYDSAIQDAEKKLMGILDQSPNIDYAAKYNDILKSVQNRPVDKPDNPLLSFAYALGSPDAAPGILHGKMMKRQQQQEQKEHDMLVLQENLLQGTIQQEIAKGEFGRALSQAKALSELQRTIGEKTRAQDNIEWERRQGIRSQDAEKLVKTRVAAVAKSLGLDDKETLALNSQIIPGLMRILTQTDLMGNTPDPTSTIQQYLPLLMEAAKKIKEARKGGGATTTPPETTGVETDVEKRQRILKGLQTKPTGQ